MDGGTGIDTLLGGIGVDNFQYSAGYGSDRVR